MLDYIRIIVFKTYIMQKSLKNWLVIFLNRNKVRFFNLLLNLMKIPINSYRF